MSARLEARDITIGPFGATMLLAVTHLDVNREQVEATGEAFVAVVQDSAGR